jgi:hypothetical protein
MLTRSESNGAVSLNKASLRMDCRIKSGNDDVENRSRDTLPRPSFVHHHDAISKNRFAPGK